MTRPRLLDLYCCAGGAAVGYHRAGFDVIGVDVEEQPDYPFEFLRADALDVLDDAAFVESFALVHTSPPCQNETPLTKGNRGRSGWSDGHVDMITPTRARLDRLTVPYVIENTQGSTVRRDVVLCGYKHFGLTVFRHRYFELGWWTTAPLSCRGRADHDGERVAGWRHGVKYDGRMVAVYGDGGGKGTVADWQTAMGIDWIADKPHLAEAIPPAYTEWLGTAFLAQLASGVPGERAA